MSLPIRQRLPPSVLVEAFMAFEAAVHRLVKLFLFCIFPSHLLLTLKTIAPKTYLTHYKQEPYPLTPHERSLCMPAVTVFIQSLEHHLAAGTLEPRRMTEIVTQLDKDITKVLQTARVTVFYKMMIQLIGDIERKRLVVGGVSDDVIEDLRSSIEGFHL